MDGEEEDNGGEDQEQDPFESLYPEEPDKVEVKLALIKGYHHKLLKRIQIKEVVFDRGLVEFKKVDHSFFIVLLILTLDRTADASF